MSQYSVLKSAIQQVVKENHNNEITGQLLQSALMSLINSLGAYYQFAGIAIPELDPGTPDQNVFYIVTIPGVYSNFGGIKIENDELAVLMYNGQWVKIDVWGGYGSGEMSVVDKTTQNKIDIGKQFRVEYTVNVLSKTGDLYAQIYDYSGGGAIESVALGLGETTLTYEGAEKPIWLILNTNGQYTAEISYNYGEKSPITLIRDYVDTFAALIDEKVDKEPGKSLIDDQYIEEQEAGEFIRSIIDQNGKFLEGITRKGKKVLPGGVSVCDYMEQELSSSPNPDHIAALLDQNDKFILGVKKNGEFDWSAGIPAHLQSYIAEQIAGASQDVSGVIQTLLSGWENSHAMHIVSVKKDGTGDFTTIQDAINSITDASVINQYEIQVYDDFYINDLTLLWKVNDPMAHGTAAPSTFVAYIITKDFVHLRGMGGKREIYVESPDVDMAGSCFQNIQTLFMIGNCRVENFVFKLKGGRYAIHQDLSANIDGLDSYKTSVYKNIDAIHYGNSDYTNGSGWGTVYAQANGFANGQTQIYINCSWESTVAGSFYGHTNPNYTLPSRVFFVNCKFKTPGGWDNPGGAMFYFGDRLSGQCNEIYVFGCDMIGYYGRTMNLPDDVAVTERKEKRYCHNIFSGYGNNMPYIRPEQYQLLTFESKVIGERIEIVGGTAMADIWGVTYKEEYGPGVYGLAVGGNFIKPGQLTQVYNLAYILGNCANSPKTLIIRRTDANGVAHTHTITFDQNYMTADGSAYQYNTTPNISQADIISAVNAAFADYFTMNDAILMTETFIDCKTSVINGGQYGVTSGTAMVKDYALGPNHWRRANEGEKPDGFAQGRIGIGKCGDVILADKNIFWCYFFGLWPVTPGAYYKVNSNGRMTLASGETDGSMIAIDERSLILK